MPNANFARERVTRRGLIALARTNCNQRRDCDNICPAPYSNTYLHAYGDRRMKMLLFIETFFYRKIIRSIGERCENNSIKINLIYGNKLITIFFPRREEKNSEKSFTFSSLDFKTSLYYLKYKHYWITVVQAILYENYHIKSYINLTMKSKSSTYVTT